jgi:hypothetical protein
MSRLPLVALALAATLVASCDPQPTDPNTNPVASAAVVAADFIAPDFDPHDFVRAVDNRLFPLRPGTRLVYKGEADGETETNVTLVTHDRKEILGISAVVVLDRVFSHGELKERTLDWYAQDEDGNVWYLGEDTKEYENGRVVSTAGSWEAGVHGAKAGIIMLAHPHVGDQYRQEFLAGEAEDVSRVVAQGVDVTVPYGSFHHCLKTVEFTRLEPGIKEAKMFCPGVGFVKAKSIQGETGHLVLTSITR